MTWIPILSGELAARAHAALAEIGAGLDASRLDEVIWAKEPATALIAGGSLFAGAAGIALFHAYAGRPEDAAAYVATAVDAVCEPMGESLAGGWTGVAFAVEHLLGRTFDRDADDPNAEIDDLLLDRLDVTPWQGKLDLMYGLVGTGLYALERRAAAPAFAARCLERVVDHLAASAERDGPSGRGATWLTSGDSIAQPAGSPASAGHYNLGVAHGVPAMIAMLARTCAANAANTMNVAVDRALPLLREAVRWLLARRTRERSPCFPCWLTLDGTAPPARMAWCYGDPGIAAVLLAAARQIGEPAWERAAIDLARTAAAYCAEAPEQAADVVDASLCHGAAGLGHLFNRLAQATGDAVLFAAARRWFARALDLHRPGEGCCGWRFRQPAAQPGAEGPRAVWAAAPGLLEGAAGIGLALLAATSSLEPEWDRALAISM